jgi:peptidoglycan/LPS O-acetylase OafA/YrhL
LRSHIPQLDGVRGVAILLVMLHHFTVIRDAPTLYRFTESGRFGVDLFFVLSGFLITGILLDSKGKRNALGHFYARRTLRIFPLYYALVAFCFLAVPLLAPLAPSLYGKVEKLARAESGTLSYYLTYTVNFLVAKNDAWRHAVLDVTWSLSIEEQFYIAWAPLILFLPKRYVPHLCVLVIVAVNVLRPLMAAAGYSPLQLYVLTHCRADSLAVGALLAWVVRREGFEARQVARAAKVVGLPLAGISVGLLAAGILAADKTTGVTLGAPLAGLLSASLLMGSLGGRLMSSGFLRFFGKYSYAIYLFHLPVRAVIRDSWFGDAQFRTLPGSPYLWQGVFYLVATLAVIPLALLSWHLWEKHFLRLKRYFEAGRRRESRTELRGVPGDTTFTVAE